MSEEIFRNLRQRLDRYSLGFPATASGIEIRILKKLFSESDAAIFLSMSQQLETPIEIATRLGRPTDEVAEQLKDMAERGLLFRWKKGDSVKYGAIPFVHGIMEFQVKNIDRELAELVEAYFLEAFDRTMLKSGAAFLRTIPVERSLEFLPNVAPYEDARQILSRIEKIVLTECICRKQKDLLGRGCDGPREVCFMFGSMGQYYLDRGMGRQVDLSEALSILAKAQEAGLVTQPATAQNPGGMCNCCGDCCGNLRALKAHPQPASLVFSNHYAVVDRELCSGCETCLDRCQMAAVTMSEDNLAEINLDRCIGCGLCAMTCPTAALRLVSKIEDQRRVPPVSTREQMDWMARLRAQA